MTEPANVAHVGQRHLGAEPLPPPVWRKQLRSLAVYMLISIATALLSVALILGAV
jgi:hypothetical protein